MCIPQILVRWLFGSDASGKTLKLFHHGRGPWMHQTRHTLPLQCSELKREAEKGRNRGKGWQTWKCCLQFTAFTPHYLFMLKLKYFSYLLLLSETVSTCNSPTIWAAFILCKNPTSSMGKDNSPLKECHLVSGALCWLSELNLGLFILYSTMSELFQSTIWVKLPREIFYQQKPMQFMKWIDSVIMLISSGLVQQYQPLNKPEVLQVGFMTCVHIAVMLTLFVLSWREILVCLF